MKTPDYVTTEDYTFSYNIWTEKKLLAGTFIKPLEPVYLPSHIKDSLEYRWFNKETEVFVYSPMGIIVIPWTIIRRV